MTIYEIDSAITNLVDENGEIADLDAFVALSMERDRKVENIGRWVKNLDANCTAIDAEIDAMKKRKEKMAAKSDKLKSYLGEILGYQKFTGVGCAVSFRKSEQVKIDIDEALLPDDLMTITEKVTRKPNKVAIKAMLKSGEPVYGCHLEECQNIKIE